MVRVETVIWLWEIGTENHLSEEQENRVACGVMQLSKRSTQCELF